eukprot:1161515-Pelagomonas_calceolata.AAC.5
MMWTCARMHSPSCRRRCWARLDWVFWVFEPAWSCSTCLITHDPCAGGGAEPSPYEAAMAAAAAGGSAGVLAHVLSFGGLHVSTSRRFRNHCMAMLTMTLLHGNAAAIAEGSNHCMTMPEGVNWPVLQDMLLLEFLSRI